MPAILVPVNGRACGYVLGFWNIFIWAIGFAVPCGSWAPIMTPGIGLGLGLAGLNRFVVVVFWKVIPPELRPCAGWLGGVVEGIAPKTFFGAKDGGWEDVDCKFWVGLPDVDNPVGIVLFSGVGWSASRVTLGFAGVMVGNFFWRGGSAYLDICLVSGGLCFSGERSDFLLPNKSSVSDLLSDESLPKRRLG